MGFLKENIGTLLKQFFPFSIGLICLTIIGLMPFLLLFFSLIGYPLLCFNLSLLGKFFTLNHLLSKLLGPLVVPAIFILGHMIIISSNPSLENVSSLVILLCQRAIFVLILPTIKFTLLVMPCSMSPYFLLLNFHPLLILILLSLLLSLIGFHSHSHSAILLFLNSPLLLMLSILFFLKFPLILLLLIMFPPPLLSNLLLLYCLIC